MRDSPILCVMQSLSSQRCRSCASTRLYRSISIRGDDRSREVVKPDGSIKIIIGEWLNGNKPCKAETSLQTGWRHHAGRNPAVEPGGCGGKKEDAKTDAEAAFNKEGLPIVNEPITLDVLTVRWGNMGIRSFRTSGLRIWRRRRMSKSIGKSCPPMIGANKSPSCWRAVRAGYYFRRYRIQRFRHREQPVLFPPARRLYRSIHAKPESGIGRNTRNEEDEHIPGW